MRGSTSVALVGIVMLTLLAVPGVAGAGSTATAVHTDTAGPLPSQDGTTLWANGTALAGGFGGGPVDISDAGPNGSMHVVYANDTGVQYVRLTTRGTVNHRATLSETDEISRVAVAADNDGRAHVIYAGTRNVGDQVVRRVAVGPDGDVAFEHDVRTGTRALHETAAVGPYGRVFAAMGNELIVFDDDTSAQTTRSVGGEAAVRIDARGDRLYVTAAEEPRRDSEAGLLLSVYELSPSAVERVGGLQLDRRPSGTFVSFELSAIAAHPDGYVAVGHKVSETSNARFYNVQTGDSVGQSQLAPHSLVYDRNTHLYLFADNGYERYGPDFERRIQSERRTVDAGLNRDGYPSVLQTDGDGTLTYVPMVVVGTERYEDPYDRFESLDETLVAENQRLREQVAELRNSSRSISINVTVQPAGGGSAFVAGGEARVIVDSGTLPADEMTVRTAGERYPVGADGTTTVPLPEVGPQELELRYRNTSTTATVEVRTAATDDGSEATEEDDSTTATTASGPGLGIISAVGAVLLAVAAALRRGV